jgi:hypothetical protein
MPPTATPPWGTVVFVSPHPWSDFPGRQFELTRAVGKRMPVAYLQEATVPRWVAPVTTTFRTPDGILVVEHQRSTATRVLRKLLPTVHERIVMRSTRRALRRNHLSDRILLWSWTHRVTLAEIGAPTVFDVIDPDLDGGATVDDFLRAAARTHARFVCTAAALREDVERAGSTATVIENASRSLLPQQAAPTGRPTALHLGTIDQRVDLALVAAVAELNPDVDFVIAGRVNRDRADDAADLAGLPNVQLPGEIFTGVPAADVGIIPFREGPVGDRINAVKMHEYLHRGIPVLATDIRECRDRPGVLIGTTAAQWSHHLRNLPASVPSSATWDDRAVEVETYLQRWFLPFPSGDHRSDEPQASAR